MANYTEEPVLMAKQVNIGVREWQKLNQRTMLKYQKE